jgi:ribulose-phosphate 3-epimerase
MQKAGASQFTFHFEAQGIDYDLDKARGLISKVKEAGMHVGIALAPETDVNMILSLIDENQLDTVLFLSVKPGFGGQKFMPSVIPKVEAVRKRNKVINIEVDGGINLENAPLVAEAGANALVAGTTVFAGPKPIPDIVPELVSMISNGVEKCSLF